MPCPGSRRPGTVPDDRETGLGEQRAAAIGAWRELSGHVDPADPIGSEPVDAGHPGPARRLAPGPAALGPADGPDVRGMPDGRLLHLRDTYPIETAWAPPWTGDQLRQIRAAAWKARLAGLRAGAEAADPPARRPEHRRPAAGTRRLLPGPAPALPGPRNHLRHHHGRPRRLGRRHPRPAPPGRRRRHRTPPPPPRPHFPSLRSAEPEPCSPSPARGLTLAAGTRRTDQLTNDLTAQHRTFADRLADRQSLCSRPRSPIAATRPGLPTVAQRSQATRSCNRRGRRSGPSEHDPRTRRRARRRLGSRQTDSSWSRSACDSEAGHEPDRGVARSGVDGHVTDHGLGVAALGIQVRVRVVLRDTPHAVTLVPERRPRQVLGQERRDPRSVVRGGRLLTSLMTTILVHLVHLGPCYRSPVPPGQLG